MGQIKGHEGRHAGRTRGHEGTVLLCHRRLRTSKMTQENRPLVSLRVQKRTFRVPKEIYVMTENNRTEDEHD